MANRSAAALVLRDGDRAELERRVRSGTGVASTAQRARIVLLAADGVANCVIAERVGGSRPMVNLWRGRYAEHGLDGLVDQQRPGRPRVVDRAKVIAATLTPPPKSLGVTHWSSRLLGARLGVDHATIAGVWRDYGVRPWRVETFKFSTDPELVAKVSDVIGLYLNPPENAIVLCVDEKSQIQALNRTQKTLPMQPGHAEQRTHDYVRHGTTTLFAALNVATGTVTGVCKQRHRHQEFLAFLKHVARAYPDTGDGTRIHLVMDNYATHKRPEVRDWLAANPRFQAHFTPTSGSWLNLVEVWFGIIDRQAIRRGTFGSVAELIAAIRQFINGWNPRAHPFIWTKTPDHLPRNPRPRPPHRQRPGRRGTSRCLCHHRHCHRHHQSDRWRHRRGRDLHGAGVRRERCSHRRRRLVREVARPQPAVARHAVADHRRAPGRERTHPD